MNFVITDTGRPMSSGMFLVLTLEALSRRPMLPYHHDRAAAARRKILDANRGKSPDDMPIALKAAASDAIAEGVARATRFPVGRDGGFHPRRNGFAGKVRR